MTTSVIDKEPRPVPQASQKVAYTSTSGCISSSIPTGASSLTCYCSTAAYIRVAYGASIITATTTDYPVPANVLVTFDVPQLGPNDGSNTKLFVAAVQDSTGGNLFVQPNAD